ncbi:RNA helicase, partial [Bonamia ostreae]
MMNKILAKTKNAVKPKMRKSGDLRKPKTKLNIDKTKISVNEIMKDFDTLQNENFFNKAIPNKNSHFNNNLTKNKSPKKLDNFEKAATPAPFINTNSNFEHYIQSPKILKNLYKNGFKYPTFIQNLAFPVIKNAVNKKTIVLGAETGSGKTIAYLTPTIDKLLTPDQRRLEGYDHNKNLARLPRAIVIGATEELCNQIKNVAIQIAENSKIAIQHFRESQTFPQIEHRDKQKFSNHLFVQTENIRKKAVKAQQKEILQIKKNENLEKSENPKWFPDVLVCTPKTLATKITPDLAIGLNFIIFDEADFLLEPFNERWTYLKSILAVFKMIEKETDQTQNFHIIDQSKSGDKIATKSGKNNDENNIVNSKKGDLRETKKDLLSPLKSFIGLEKSKLKYIFCGATLGKKIVQKFLHKTEMTQKQTNRLNPLNSLFKNSVWIQSPMLHHVLPQLETSWKLVKGEIDHQISLLKALGVNSNFGDNENCNEINLEKLYNKKLINFTESKILERNLDRKFCNEKTLIFCAFPQNVAKVNAFLKKLGFDSVAIHEKMSLV